MAPPPRYDPPHVQLARLMVEGRRAGLDFEACWQLAVRPGQPVVMTNTPNPPAGAVRWPSDRMDRRTWQEAITASKDGWRRAYERTPPTPYEGALRMLAPGLAALDEVSAERSDAELAPAGIEARFGLPSAA